MTVRQRHPRRTTDNFAAALRGARSEKLSGIAEDERRFPDPYCLDRPDLYVDYDVPPSDEDAMDLCIECPLMIACLENARRVKPSWGVLGGYAWVNGRQVRLMKHDDPRRLGIEDEAA